MVVRELIAKIAYELDKNSVNKADNSINKTKSKLSKIANVGSNAWNKISNSANKTRISINGIGKEAIYTSEQLRRMGAYQDKLGRWHGSNGKYLKINADTTQARANILSLQGSMHSLINGARMLGQAIIAAFAIDRIIAFTQAIQKSADEMMNLDGRLRTLLLQMKKDLILKIDYMCYHSKIGKACKKWEICILKLLMALKNMDLIQKILCVLQILYLNL